MFCIKIEYVSTLSPKVIGDLNVVSSFVGYSPRVHRRPNPLSIGLCVKQTLKNPPIATAPLHVVVAEDVAIATPDLEPWVLVPVVANVATDEADT